MKTIKVRLTFTEGILGTSPGNEDVFRDYVASKAPDAASIEDEVAALVKQLEEQMLSAARELDFERAAKLRDQMLSLRGETPPDEGVQKKRRRTRESTRHH